MIEAWRGAVAIFKSRKEIGYENIDLPLSAGVVHEMPNETELWQDVVSASNGFSRAALPARQRCPQARDKCQAVRVPVMHFANTLSPVGALVR
jgi:hypothetical protein